MATYVLVHGAAHGGWCYRSVARQLRSHGHAVYAPTLTGLGERSHLLGSNVSLDLHIADIAGVLRFEDLRDVILVGHSYGGMVITGAADRELDRVGQLVYLDAAQPHDGEALTDLVAGLEYARQTSRVVDGVELFLFPEEGFNYGVTDAEVVTWMRDRLTPHPWITWEQPVKLANEQAVLALPTTAIMCPDTHARMPRETNADRALAANNVWEIDAGHDLMLAAPEQVAELLLQLA